ELRERGLGEHEPFLPGERLQIVLQIERGGVTTASAAAQSLADNPLELRRIRGIDGRWRRWLRLQERAQDLVFVSAREERSPGRELIENDRDAKDIASAIEWLAERLLGGHVAEFSLEGPMLGRRQPIGGLGDAKVNHLDMAV